MQVNPTKTVNELIVALSYATDVENEKRIFHGWKVAILAALIAENKVAAKELKNIFYAALLHDIGGVGFPFHIIHYLNRRDSLSQNILLSHPIVGAQLVSRIPNFLPSAQLILDHHEWINGHGYPRAKTKKEISRGAQVLRIADSIDIALQSGRFRKLKELKNKLSKNIGKEYPQKLFSHALDILRGKKFFARISKVKNITQILEEIKNRVGKISVPLKIDAIGTTLEVIAEISDMKHPYTYGHALRVSRYAMSIALGMQLDHDTVTRVKWAALMHDLGKISVSRSILDKPQGLGASDFGKVKKHSDIVEEILETVPTLKALSLIAASHHEHFDGSGYQRGLRGEEIPLETRIISVADAFDAMTSNRPYRDALSSSSAYQRIAELSGKQFDPAVVKIALPILKNL